MKKVKKIITGFLTVFIFMALVLPMTTVKASEKKEAVEKRMYTVTFRAGNIACFDMFMMYVAPIVTVLGLILTVVLIIFHVLDVELFDFFSYLYASGILFFIVFYILNVAMNIFVVKYNKKSAKNILGGIFLFSFFIATWIPINIICLFKKTDSWEQIKHDRSDVDLDSLVK